MSADPPLTALLGHARPTIPSMAGISQTTECYDFCLMLLTFAGKTANFVIQGCFGLLLPSKIVLKFDVKVGGRQSNEKTQTGTKKKNQNGLLEKRAGAREMPARGNLIMVFVMFSHCDE